MKRRRQANVDNSARDRVSRQLRKALRAAHSLLQTSVNSAARSVRPGKASNANDVDAMAADARPRAALRGAARRSAGGNTGRVVRSGSCNGCGGERAGVTVGAVFQKNFFCLEEVSFYDTAAALCMRLSICCSARCWMCRGNRRQRQPEQADAASHAVSGRASMLSFIAEADPTEGCPFASEQSPGPSQCAHG